VVITVGSWKKLDWPRELQTAEITSLSHDRNIHRTQEESRGPIPPQQGVSSERPKGAVRGSSGGRGSPSPALSNSCNNGHVSVVCLASS